MLRPPAITQTNKHQPAGRRTRSAGCARIHRFRDSHNLSAQYGPDWWIPIYRRAFPTLMSAVAIEQDGWAQRGGIDRLLTLACGRTFTVDEKIRTADWPDVLLERWSDEARRSPGWVQKPLAADFVAYAHAQPRRASCYLSRRSNAPGGSTVGNGSDFMGRGGRRTRATFQLACRCLGGY